MDKDLKQMDILEIRSFVDHLFNRMLKDDSYRNKIIATVISAILYVSGIILQIFKYGLTKEYDSLNRPLGYKMTFRPLKMFFREMFDISYWLLVLLFISILTLTIILYIRADTGERRDERGVLSSKRGTYGTSKRADLFDMAEYLYVGDIEGSQEPILGLYPADPNYNPKYDNPLLPIDFDEYTDEEVSAFYAEHDPEMYVITYPLPEETDHTNNFNHHKLIIGGSGTGKSFTKINTDILQIISKGESFVSVDPKGANYADTVDACYKAGYTVKVFNLNVDELLTSDSWSPLHEIDPKSDNLESLAQQFADVIVSNTSDEQNFHTDGQKNLLTALALYTITNGEEGTIGELYSLLAMDQGSLIELMSNLPDTHPAKAPWNIFHKGSDAVVGNNMTGLGGALQVFQSKLVRDITSMPDIDLALPGREKCAYYVILSDSDKSLNFMSSLFFSFLFTKLNEEAKRQFFITGKERLKVPVNILLDEFPNIGKIPDFHTKLSTVRSRGIAISIVIQGLGQLQAMYPQNQWENIVANCDELTFLGSLDGLTAEYISKKTGTTTIKTQSGGVSEGILSKNANAKTSSRGEGQRPLYTPAEVREKPRGTSFVFISSNPMMVLRPMPYIDHPLAKGLRTVPLDQRIPYYRTQPEFYKKYKITPDEQVLFKERLGIEVDDIYVDRRHSKREAITSEEREEYKNMEKEFSRNIYKQIMDDDEEETEEGSSSIQAMLRKQTSEKDEEILKEEVKEEVVEPEKDIEKDESEDVDLFADLDRQDEEVMKSKKKFVEEERDEDVKVEVTPQMSMDDFIDDEEIDLGEEEVMFTDDDIDLSETRPEAEEIEEDFFSSLLEDDDDDEDVPLYEKL